ncbi:MAG: prolyl oligopeptidase family serine peptidase [Pyrinomonadaceae bacterium]|nr:prolyl oligopeptidase family serine peptidase [Pyrinomonadaceae bacterium]
MKIFRLLACCIFTFLLAVSAFSQYQKPPQNVEDILNAPAIPNSIISPSKDVILLTETLRYPPISEFAQPMLRIAGLRINPNTNGQHRPFYAVKLTLKNVATGKETPVTLPPNPNILSPVWSDDGKYIAVGNQTPTGIELWILEVATAKLTKLNGVQVNTAFGGYSWMPNQKSLFVNLVPKNRGTAPQYQNLVPTGPSIQETSGRGGNVATVQDLLKSPNDEKLFEYYCTSQLAIVDLKGGIKNVGAPAIFDDANVSPDGNYVLTNRVQKPFSYLYPFSRFPHEVEIWDMSGKLVNKFASIPLLDNLPNGGVSTGKRSFGWIPTEPATLIWAEALDGGNPRNKVTPRDKVLKLAAPFTAEPSEIIKTEQRFAGRQFGENGLMFVTEINRETQKRKMWMLNYRNSSVAPRVVYELNVNDRYNDIGNFVTKRLPNGYSVVLQDGDDVFTSGNGATPQGDRPFLRRFSLKDMSVKTEIFRSKTDEYESFAGFTDDKAFDFFTRKESQIMPPNLYLNKPCPPNAKCVAAYSSSAITNFTDPTPQLRGIKKQLVRYKRADGVDLSFTLYLPPNYKEGTRLPTVVWAYPESFTDAATAGQVTGSTNRFTQINGMSHLFFLLQGYAVLDNASMPIVGPPETKNDTFIKQVVDSAQAAIDKAVEMGVTDRDRVGVGGHSYGAFMTANLLAHSDLFRAGIARSGAYNRTLTPFGFQDEERNFWQAMKIYEDVSPFFFANKINEPLLMTHGEADNNQGTFPIQSERLFAAIQGNGGTARLVMLPLEAHGYAAKESIEHTLFEMINWFDKYVKNAKPRDKKGD